MFIFKYFSRTGLNPILIFIAYSFFILIFTNSFNSLISRISETKIKTGFWILVGIMILAIAGILIYIQPLTIRVDRWSALTYFWDYFFRGEYPYSARTHIGVMNYPSPFPVWQVLNLPFYLMGDVGIGLIFYLIVIAFVVQSYFKSYRKSFYFFILILLSPGYWWEVIVRSDSLNNAWFVFMLIIWFEKSKITIANNFILIAILSGLVITTRLTAILPFTIYFFRPYLNLNLKRQILFPVLVLIVSFLAFSPFIFWDTNTWIFFTRNPFMSQADKGYWSILLISVIAGIFMALRWKNKEQFFYYTSLFVFVFIALSQIGLYIRSDFSPNFITGSICDISYFNLFLPWCLTWLTFKVSS
ncbi:MAG: hypothetical protein JHC39_02785 [Lentimicrobium sp.]|nr:hypothetical protein [Lentimicrobium sp.]